MKGPRRFQPYRAFSSSMGLCLDLACKYIQQNLSFHFLTRLEEHACSKNGTFQSVKGTKTSGNCRVHESIFEGEVNSQRKLKNCNIQWTDTEFDSKVLSFSSKN